MAQMSRHEWWRLRYSSRRYLADTPGDELAERFRDVMNNITRINEKGQISLLSPQAGGAYWMEMFTHLLEEYNARGGLPPGIITREAIPQPSHPRPPRGFQVLAGRKMAPDSECLIKVGKSHYMAAMYEEGQIRIAPASLYSDPSLNYAIKDNELSRSAVLPKAEVKLTLMDRETGAPQQDLELKSNVVGTFEVSTNYYVYCMCHSYDYRILNDFDADSLVVIKKPEVFVSMLREAAAKQLSDWKLWHQPVQYLDPYDVRREDLVAFVTKHFRYAYQKEYRFIWLPPAPVMELEPIFVALGSLRDIADYHSL